MVQKEKIFNIVLAPDLLISASDYESSLIIKNQLLAGHKLISPGWIFGNTLRERIKKLNQLLIILVHQIRSLLEVMKVKILKCINIVS